MTQISNRVNNLAQSATLAMSQKSAELKAQGVDVINMSVGEPDFPTPDFIKRAAKKAIDENYTTYTPVAGYLSLRKAISGKLATENGLTYAPEQIVVSNGAKQSLCNAVLSIVNPGDEVIIPTPAWVSYVEMVKLAEGVTIEVAASIDQEFKITPAQLRDALSERTRLIILCSPSNPTGSVYTRSELQGLVDVLADYPKVTVLADEIYEHINFTGGFTSLASFPEIADRTVVINGVSKAYAMTGWRIGFMAAPSAIAKACSKLQSQYSSNASSIAQKAAEAAYLGPQECVESMREAFERRRNLIVELASHVAGWHINRPDGAFYLFPRVTDLIGKQAPDGTVIKSSGDYAMYLLREAHVATVDGAAFCAPGYIRLSYATSDDNIREALRRISAATANLK